MPFADTIDEAAPERYRHYYLRYRAVRDVIFKLALGSEPGRQRLKSHDFMFEDRPEARFQDLLREELKKVNDFACLKHEDIFLGLRRISEELASILQSGKTLTSDYINTMKQRIQSHADEMIHLDLYVRLNYMGFRKLTQKFDKALEVSGSMWFMSRLHHEPFCNVRFDDI